MVDRPSPARRPGRMATFVALGVSGLLHGALATTFLAWDRGPAPLPASQTIMVELVSIAPQPGPADPGQAATPAATGGEDDTAVPPAEEPDTVFEHDPQAPMAEPAASPPAEESLPPSVPAAAEAVPTPRYEPVAPRPNETSAASELPRKSAPPPELVGILPPARPQMAPPRPVEPKNIATTFDKPIAEIIPEETYKAQRTSSDSTDATLLSRDTIPVRDIEMQTAGLPDGGEIRDTLDGGAGDQGGLFSGPSFHLGSAYNPLPRYPSIARRRGWEGRVVLRVEVGADGHPLSVAIASSSSFSALDEAAGRAVRRWRFEPAQRAGLPVVAFVDVPIVFRLQD